MNLSDLNTMRTDIPYEHRTPSSTFITQPPSTGRRQTKIATKQTPVQLADTSIFEDTGTTFGDTIGDRQPELTGFAFYTPQQSSLRPKMNDTKKMDVENKVEIVQREQLWNASTAIEKTQTGEKKTTSRTDNPHTRSVKSRWMEKTRKDVEQSTQSVKKRVRTMVDPLATLQIEEEENETGTKRRGEDHRFGATDGLSNTVETQKRSIFSQKELKILRWLHDNKVNVFAHIPPTSELQMVPEHSYNDDLFFSPLPHTCVCDILADGISFPQLLQSLTHHPVAGAISNPKYMAAKRNNIERCLNSLRARSGMNKRFLFKIDEIANASEGESAESLLIAWGVLEDIATEFKFATPTQKQTSRGRQSLIPKPDIVEPTLISSQPQIKPSQTRGSIDKTATFMKPTGNKTQGVRPATAKKVRFAGESTDDKTQTATTLKPSFSPSLNRILRQHVIEESPEISPEEEGSCLVWLRNEVMLDCPDVSICFEQSTLNNPLANGVVLSDLVTMCRRAASIRDDWSWQSDSGFNIKTGKFVDPFSEEAQRLSSERERLKREETNSQKTPFSRKSIRPKAKNEADSVSVASDTRSSTTDRIQKLIGTSGNVISPHDTIPHFKCHRAPKSLEQIRENYRVIFTWLMRTERVEKQFLWDTEPYLQGDHGMIFGLLLNIRSSFGEAINDLYRVYGYSQPIHYSITVTQKPSDPVSPATTIRPNGLSSTLTQGENFFREKTSQKGTFLPYTPEQRYNLEQSLVQWVNELALIPGPFVNSFSEIVQTVRTGVLLGEIYFLIAGKRLAHFDPFPQTEQSKRRNVEKTLQSLKQVDGLWHVNKYSAEMVSGGDWSTILGLLEDLHAKYDLQPPPARHRAEAGGKGLGRSLTPTATKRGTLNKVHTKRPGSAEFSPAKKGEPETGKMEETQKEKKLPPNPYFGQNYREQSMNQSQVQQQRESTISQFVSNVPESSSHSQNTSIVSGSNSFISTLTPGAVVPSMDGGSSINIVANTKNRQMPPIYTSDPETVSPSKGSVIAPKPLPAPNKRFPQMSYHDKATGRTKIGFLGPDVFTSTDPHADEAQDEVNIPSDLDSESFVGDSTEMETSQASLPPQLQIQSSRRSLDVQSGARLAASGQPSPVSRGTISKISSIHGSIVSGKKAPSDKRSVFGRASSITAAAAQLAQGVLKMKHERKMDNVVFSSEDFSTTLNKGDHLIPPPPQALLQRKTVQNKNENGTINLTKLAMQTSGTQEQVNEMAEQVNPSTGYLLSKWMENLGLKQTSPFTLESPVIHEFSDGVLLCRLVEKLNHVPLHGWTKKPKSQASFLHNINLALENLAHNKKIPLSFLNCARDVMAGHQEHIVDLLEAIRKGYRVVDQPVSRINKP
ncbi:hypothetical protein BLNAU_15866 [Blattamonas nauphoetae]|uniref:Calponin-homology (CH) domain-containing protein n=1 Tax=Blattamonas nauphoetae TaxID=2049346 RepID=A0ABQ9XD21_9EUKA|nr:hypothetical protein BLNAU_15866 [Blattamonas nauphoetae]